MAKIEELAISELIFEDHSFGPQTVVIKFSDGSKSEPYKTKDAINEVVMKSYQNNKISHSYLRRFQGEIRLSQLEVGPRSN